MQDDTPPKSHNTKRVIDHAPASARVGGWVREKLHHALRDWRDWWHDMALRYQPIEWLNNAMRVSARFANRAAMVIALATLGFGYFYIFHPESLPAMMRGDRADKSVVPQAPPQADPAQHGAWQALLSRLEAEEAAHAETRAKLQAALDYTETLRDTIDAQDAVRPTPQIAVQPPAPRAEPDGQADPAPPPARADTRVPKSYRLLLALAQGEAYIAYAPFDALRLSPEDIAFLNAYAPSGLPMLVDVQRAFAAAYIDVHIGGHIDGHITPAPNRTNPSLIERWLARMSDQTQEADIVRVRKTSPVLELSPQARAQLGVLMRAQPDQLHALSEDSADDRAENSAEDSVPHWQTLLRAYLRGRAIIASLHAKLDAESDRGEAARD